MVFRQILRSPQLDSDTACYVPNEDHRIIRNGRVVDASQQVAPVSEPSRDLRHSVRRPRKRRPDILFAMHSFIGYVLALLINKSFRSCESERLLLLLALHVS